MIPQTSLLAASAAAHTTQQSAGTTSATVNIHIVNTGRHAVTKNLPDGFKLDIPAAQLRRLNTVQRNVIANACREFDNIPKEFRQISINVEDTGIGILSFAHHFPGADGQAQRAMAYVHLSLKKTRKGPEHFQLWGLECVAEDASIGTIATFGNISRDSATPHMKIRNYEPGAVMIALPSDIGKKRKRELSDPEAERPSRIPKAGSSQAVELPVIDGIEISRIAGNDAESRNFNEAIDCFIKLFTPKNEEEYQVQHRRSMQDIDFYIGQNFTADNAPSEPIRELMIAIDMETQNLLDFAYRYGPGNLLIRNAIGPEEAGSVGSVDIDSTVRRSALEHLALTIAKRVWKEVHEQEQTTGAEIQDSDLGKSLRSAITLIASDMLIGTAACTGYSNLLAFMVTELCSQEKWKDVGKITVQTFFEPTLRGEIIDHVQVVVSIKDREDKHLFTIACNPWGSVHTPLAMKDCAYEGGTELLKFEHDQPVPPYKSWIYQDMQEATGRIRTTMEDPGFQSWAEGELLKFMNEEEEDGAERTEERPLYSLNHSLDGYVDMETLSSAKPGITLPPQRHRHHLTANNSPLAGLLHSYMQI